ncbi:MAG: ribosome biogenesis/translation initiation ATPase RLI [Candidatus Norongarragalinales archaeon]
MTRKQRAATRIAVIDAAKCAPQKCGYACVHTCPVKRMGGGAIAVPEPEAKRAEETALPSDAGKRTPHPVINENECVGCALCAKKCLFNAIKIVNLPKAFGDPFFQYGQNSFRLYGFLLPPKASVTGVIGVNGIGKTTLLKLLDGSLAPNFGVLHHELTVTELRSFLPPAAALFFTKPSSERSVSVKQQYVDEIVAEQPDESIESFVRGCDGRDAYAQAVKQFELQDCLHRKLSEASGGELQRAAIAAAFVREAQTFFFDEPSSFLDVKQRLLAAKGIRSLAEKEGKSVVVVEHDLAVLDYLSDNVCVLYGEKGAFGVVSQPKSTRVGINEFLDGFVREENVRFREHSIRFHVRAPTSGGVRKERVFSYPPLSKKYAEFELRVAGGEVFAETVGVLGPNAIGKTTFVKLLAGVEKSDDEAELPKRKVAYKPQYLKSDFAGTVRELFSKFTTRPPHGFAEITRKLEIDGLFDKKVCELSGGELQRLSIALVLIQECDLRLIDEPSAFLDVEQRLEAAELIKKTSESSGVPCFVVDHDLLFIDAVSDKILLFNGTPAKEGRAGTPQAQRDGMHDFLREMGVTFRRDPQTGRPRANKEGSVADREQKDSGNYYYV